MIEHPDSPKNNSSGQPTSTATTEKAKDVDMQALESRETLPSDSRMSQTMQMKPSSTNITSDSSNLVGDQQPTGGLIVSQCALAQADAKVAPRSEHGSSSAVADFNVTLASGADSDQKSNKQSATSGQEATSSGSAESLFSSSFKGHSDRNIQVKPNHSGRELKLREAAFLNSLMPAGFKLLIDGCDPKKECNFEVQSDDEGQVVIGRNCGTSRLIQLAENKSRQKFKKEKEMYRKMTAVDPKLQKQRQNAQAKRQQIKNYGRFEPEKPVYQHREEVQAQKPATAPIQEPVNLVQTQDSAHLKCQNLIHRLYTRAYEMKFLEAEFLNIMMELSQKKFNKSSDLTSRIKETICEKATDPFFNDFFEYANEQMVSLGLGDSDFDTELYRMVQKPQVAAAQMQNDNRNSKSFKHGMSQRKLQSNEQSLETTVGCKQLQQTTLSQTGQIVKQSLTNDQTAFIQSWIPKMDEIQCQGLMQIVIDSGKGTSKDEQFEFDLMTLPYDVCLKVLKYVESMAANLQKSEKKKNHRLPMYDSAVPTDQEMMRTSTEQRLELLKQQEDILVDGLRDLPISEVSKLVDDKPDIEMPEDLLQKVWHYREEQESLKRLQQSQQEKQQYQDNRYEESESSSSSDSDSDFDEDELLGNRKRGRRDDDVTQLWQQTESKRARH